MPDAPQHRSTHADSAVRELPLDARMSKGRLAMAWWSICSAMVYLFIGATLARTYGAGNATCGMVSAVLVFGLLNGFLARFAIRTGLSCSALSQAMLGRAGGAVATLLLGVTALYYAVFEGSVLAVAISKTWPGVGYGLAALIVVAYSTPLVFGSVQAWLNRLNAVLLPFYLAGLTMLTVTAARHPGAVSAAIQLGEGRAVAHGWWYCFSTYLGLLVLSMCTMDFGRFGQPDDARFHQRVTFGVPFYAVTFLLNGCIGILIVGALHQASVSETGVVDASLALLGSGAGLAWVWVTQTRINTANFFLATLNLQAFIEEVARLRVPKIVCALAVGAAVFALMRSSDVFKYLVTALDWQSILITSWVGVALSHVAARNGPGGERPEHEGRAGLVAWMLAVLSGAACLAGGETGGFWYPVVTVIVAIAAHRALRALLATRLKQTGSAGA